MTTIAPESKKCYYICTYCTVYTTHISQWNRFLFLFLSNYYPKSLAVTIKQGVVIFPSLFVFTKFICMFIMRKRSEPLYLAKINIIQKQNRVKELIQHTALFMIHCILFIHFSLMVFCDNPNKARFSQRKQKWVSHG